MTEIRKSVKIFVIRGNGFLDMENMKKYLQKYFYLIFLSFLAIFLLGNINSALAAMINPGFDVIEQPLGMSNQDIRIVAAKLINQATGLLGILTVLVILYGGFSWMVSFGDEEKTKQAKSAIASGIIGLIIIFVSFSFANYILTTILNAT